MLKMRYIPFLTYILWDFVAGKSLVQVLSPIKTHNAISNFKLLIPVIIDNRFKHNADQQFETIFPKSRNDYNLYEDGPFSNIPSEEFVLEDDFKEVSKKKDLSRPEYRGRDEYNEADKSALSKLKSITYTYEDVDNSGILAKKQVADLASIPIFVKTVYAKNSNVPSLRKSWMGLDTQHYDKLKHYVDYEVDERGKMKAVLII